MVKLVPVVKWRFEKLKLMFPVFVSSHNNQIMEQVLDFWFPNNQFQKFWFDQSVDETVKERFEPLLHMAESGELNSWLNEHDSKL